MITTYNENFRATRKAFAFFVFKYPCNSQGYGIKPMLSMNDTEKYYYVIYNRKFCFYYVDFLPSLNNDEEIKYKYYNGKLV